MPGGIGGHYDPSAQILIDPQWPTDSCFRVLQPPWQQESAAVEGMDREGIFKLVRPPEAAAQPPSEGKGGLKN